MDVKLFAIVFGTVFLAELGDKTQLATVLFASREPAAVITVFLGASLALVASTAVAVAAGSLLAQQVDPRIFGWIAGAGFIAIGVWTLWTA